MTTSSRKSVAILFLGGATIDERNRLGDTVTKPAHVKPWLRAMSEMDIIAETEGVYIASGLSHIGIPEWKSISESIKELYSEVKGFVVVHQLETLPAAAAALSLMLPNIGKPVVLCGSPLLSAEEKKFGRPTVKSATDFGAKASFINAVQVAVSDISGVVVVYGSHIYRGATLVGPMNNVQGDILGKIDFGIRFFGQPSKRHDQAVKIQSAFDTRVAVAEYLPGVDLHHLLHLPRGTRAIFLSSPEGTGAISGVVDQLRGSLPPLIPIVVYSAASETSVPGTLTVRGSSRSAALLRLMWALGQTNDAKKLKKLLS
jgi:L-asparaginase/Glu-tRNA(Gln) amidotransferase subunit D